MLTEVSTNVPTSAPASGKPRILRKLQGDWVELQSSDGETYFANVVTKETSWENPFGEEDPIEKENTTPQLTVHEMAGRESVGPSDRTATRAPSGADDMAVSLITSEFAALSDLAALADSSLAPLPLSGTATHSSLTTRTEVSSLPQTEACGVGVLLEQSEEGKGVLIERVFKGGPADVSKQIHVGDEVVSVNHVRVEGRAPAELRRQVVGPSGLPVVLGLRKAADGEAWQRGDLIEVVLVRRATPDAAALRSAPPAELVRLEAELAAARAAAAESAGAARAATAEAEAFRARATGAESELSRCRAERAHAQADAGRRELQLREAADSLKETLRVEGIRAAALQERVRELEEGACVQMQKETTLQLSLQQGEASADDARAELAQALAERDAALQLVEEVRRARPSETALTASPAPGEAMLREQLAEARAALEAAAAERERVCAAAAESAQRHEQALAREQRRADERVGEAVARERAAWERREAEQTEKAERRTAAAAAEARATIDKLKAQLVAARSAHPAAAAAKTPQNATHLSPSVAGWVGAGPSAFTPLAAQPGSAAFASPRVASQRLADQGGGTSANWSTPSHASSHHAASLAAPFGPSESLARLTHSSRAPPVTRGAFMCVATVSPSVLQRHVLLLAQTSAGGGAAVDSDAAREAVHELAVAAIDAAARATVLQLPNTVPALAARLSAEDPLLVRFATLALGNLAMDAAGRAAIAQAGRTMEQLTALVSCSDVETARYAGMAIGNLVLEADCRRALLAAGPVVANLVTCLGSGDKQTVRYAAGALRNVAVEEHGRHQVLATAGSQVQLAALISSADPSTARYAAACLKNLSLSRSP